MQYFTIFHHLDEQKRYAGATLLEILAVGAISFTSFAFQRLAAGLFISLIVFRVIRAISRSSQLKYYKRWLCFHYQDLRTGPNKSRRFFF